MKKRVIASLLTVAAVLSLSACGKAFKCDICGEEKTGKSYKETVFGAEVTYCKECHDAFEEVGKELQNLLK